MRTVRALAFVAGSWAGAADAQLAHESFASKGLGREVPVAVQLPPSYARGAARYPLVVALHGLFESERFWEQRGLQRQLDERWASGALPEFVLVAPGAGNSFFVNGPAGAYQDLATDDVVAWAEARFRLAPGRDARALWGVSMGGYGALRIAFARPEVYSRVATHSAMLLLRPPTRAEGAGRWHMQAFEAVFGSPIDAARWAANDPLALAEKVDHKAAPALSFDCGREDRYGLAAGHERLHERLQARGVAHEFGLYPGDHGYEYVRGVLERSLAFVTRGWAAARR